MRLKRAFSTVGLSLLAGIVLTMGVILALSAVRASASGGLLRLSAVSIPEEPKPTTLLGPIEGFYEALQKIEQYFYRPLTPEDRRRLTYTAIKGMVRALEDPYSRFMTPEESKDFRIEISGQVQGIGAVLTERDGKVMVHAPFKGGPAEKAGLKPFDVIVKVDGKPVRDFGLQKVVNMIRGKPGTKVTLTVWRAGKKPFDVTIVRETVSIPVVEWKMKADRIGYIKLFQFNEKTPAKLDEALSDLASKGAEGLILDLRGNPGGPLDGAVEVASRFLERGVIVRVKGRHQQETIEVLPNRPKSPLKGPIVVLVDEGTASASEIVAATLKDHGKAVIVGTPTFGKGTIQTVAYLSDGSSLALTSAKYFRPNGKPIDPEHPITPDVEVRLTEEDEAKGRDLQIERAIKILQEKSAPPEGARQTKEEAP